MKNRIKIKLTAITLGICMLLSGSLMPIWAADSLTKESNATESKVQESIIPEEDIALEQVDLLAKEDEALWKFIDRESPNAEKHTARLAALEEPDTFVFQNSDGTRTVYFMEEDVKYVDSNGSTVIKDISLTKANNGFGIVRNEVDLLIPDKLTSGVDISLADYSVKLIPQNTATNVLAEQKNNSVVYNGVFGEKTALVYTPVLSGIKEDIVLSEYTENASYTFILKTNGLVLRNRDGKYCLFSLSKKDPVFY
ncbi:MAG: hypothetical protein IKB23_03490, partial [Clostridia bacterium]|nr:hypothetical protein [Clostridia bacterium]